MKRIVSCLMTFIIIAFCFSNYSFAAITPKVIISVGSGNYAIEVYSNTTINEVISKLGKPKIEADSAFGGKSYTFYTDNNYSNHLFLETNADGTIMSFGSADPTFKVYSSGSTEKCQYGDNYNFNPASTGASGMQVYDNKAKVYGGCWYNFSDGTHNVNQIKQDYEDRYNSDPARYLKGINEHSVVMYNIASHNMGKDANLVFNEDYFYINQQLKEFGSSLYEYIFNNDKARFKKNIGSKTNTYIAVKPGGYAQEYLINNIALWASAARGNLNTDFSKANIAMFDYYNDQKQVLIYSVDPDLFNIKTNNVALTSEEQTKLNNGRSEYTNYLNNFSKSENLYSTDPQYETPSGLVAGKINNNIEQGLVDYNNAIRVAGGLQKLSYDTTFENQAQHKATLLQYRKEKLGLTMNHYFTQPDGVSKDFYNTAMGYGLLSHSECIGWTSGKIDKDGFIFHVNNYYDDSSDLSKTFGHRTSMLNPRFSKIGLGSAGNHDVIEIGAFKNTDVYWAAWPSKGVTFLETLKSRQFVWSMKFYDKYTIQDTTKVKVKCLNTNQTWEFNEQESSNKRRYSINETPYEETSNRVLFYDETIYPENNYVYEITLKNVKDNSIGNDTNYVYRAVFKNAIENDVAKINNISIQAPAEIEMSSNNTYAVQKDKEYKFNAIIDNNDAIENHIEWTSSNPEAVKVMQNGLVKVVSEFTGNITITAKNYSSGKSATITLELQEEVPIQQLFILYTEEFVEGHPEMTERRLGVTFYPSNTTMSKVLDFYSVNEDVASIDKNGIITVHKPGTVIFVVMAVNGVSENYKITYSYADLGLEEPKPLTAISLNKTNLTLKNGSSETLKVTYTPADTTEDKTILWSSNNTSVVTVDSNGKVTCKACEGTATITATSKANSSIKATCKITASHKDSKLTLHSAVAATCNKAGNTAYYTCSGCDNYYSDENGKNKISDKSSVIVPIDANAHTWDNGKVTKEATCTANGEKTYTCKNNSSHTKKETIKATGHTITKVPFVKPTYEKEGNIEYYKCSKCNKLFSDANGKQTTTAQKVKLEKMPFPDVEYGKWYVDYVRYVKDNNLITGYANGNFGPNDTITRAQVATILYRMAGSPKVSGSSGLKDENTFSGWYKDAVIWASKNGIVTGYGQGENAGKFVPNNNVSREELMIMFMRYAKNIKKMNVTVNQSLTSFSDYKTAHNYALEGIKWAVNKGVVTGKTINSKLCLDPLGTATRAEMAKMIKVFIEL